MLIVGTDEAAVEADLVRGRLVCPTCEIGVRPSSLLLGNPQTISVRAPGPTPRTGRSLFAMNDRKICVRGVSWDARPRFQALRVRLQWRASPRPTTTVSARRYGQSWVECVADGLPAYIETQKESNVPFYRRHGCSACSTRMVAQIGRFRPSLPGDRPARTSHPRWPAELGSRPSPNASARECSVLAAASKPFMIT